MECKHIIPHHVIFILILLGIMTGLLFGTTISYADEGNKLYDTIPIDAHGNEGDVIKAIDDSVYTIDWYTGNEGNITFSLVKVPQDTTAIKVYDSEVSWLLLPAEDDVTMYPKDTYCKDGWWTIPMEDLASENTFSNYNSVVNATINTAVEQSSDKYCKEATYYELFDQPNMDAWSGGKHLFVQVGDENSPLDVLANYEDGAEDQWAVNGGYFEGDSNVALILGAGKRNKVFNDTNQSVWYTVDGSDPTDSNTAIQYSGTKPINVTSPCSINAAAKTEDNKWGAVSTFECNVLCQSPVISPESGAYSEPFEATISCDTEDATVYYTTNGLDPVDEDGSIIDEAVEYTGPITIEKDTVLKAVTVYDEIVSEIVTATYKLSTAMSIDFYDDDQGVWLRENTLATEKEGTIVTPYDHSKCKLIVGVKDGTTVTLNDKPVSPNENGDYILELDVKQNAELNDPGQDNIITVSSDGESDTYTVYCIAALFGDLPDKVTDYFVPASQYTNTAGIGDAPNTTLIGKCGDVMRCSSVGNFGGYITWFYKDGIVNDPKDPFGVDFIVYGNSFDGTNEAAEPGNVLVSEDGTDWYTLAGSLHYDNNSQWNQQVTYSGNDEQTGFNFEGLDLTGTVEYPYPDPSRYPLHKAKEDFTQFVTKGTYLSPEEGTNEHGNTRPPYPAFGYADTGLAISSSNESKNPYDGLVKDHDYVDRVTTGRNGDAFDIAWAVDENGNPVKLDKIHYVKVQTASFINNENINEKSTEVSCMRIAKAADSAVGVTAAPKSIKIDGTSVDLKPGEMVNASVNGIFDVVVDAPEDANVYINSLRSHTAFMDKAPHGIVRVIVQEGQKEPLIYYFKIDQSGTASGQKVTFDTGKGLMQDKEKLVCYFDADTIEHVGTDGVVEFPEATAPNEKQAFAGWTDESGEFVAAYSAETTGDITLTAKYAKAEDVEAAKKVTEQIEALKAKEDLTAEDADAVKAARDAYDALTDAQKELISAETLTKLTEAEAAVSAAKVDDVIKQIEEISDADKLTLEDKEKVEAAREAYDSLTEEDQAKVTNSPNLKVAEATIAKLEAEDKAAKAEDRAAAAEAKVADAEAKAAAAEAKVKEAEDKVAEAQAKLEELQKDKAADEEALAKAEKDLEKANADLKAAKAEQETTAERLEKAQKELKDAEEKAAKAEASQKEAAAAAEAAAAGAQDEIEALKAKLAIEQQKNAVLSKTVKILKPKAKKKSALIRWKKAGKGLTYVVYRSTKPTKGFKKAATSKKLKVTVKKLKKGKTYYFKVRAYKKIADKKVWTGYSKVVKVKIKK